MKKKDLEKLKNNDGCSGNESTAEENLTYRVRDDFLSDAEFSFFNVLKNAVNGQAIVCPKVALKDIFFVPRNSDNNMTAFNKIARKHVDFLLCELKTTKPLVGIELDDSSHSRAKRVERDHFVDDVFASANLPLLRIKVQNAYNINELRNKLASFINTDFRADVGNAMTKYNVEDTKTTKTISGDIKSEAQLEGSMFYNTVGYGTEVSPLCPKCGADMVKRTATRGVNKGNQFYGCSNFPKCKEVLEA